MQRPDLFVENLTEKLMLYALGREVEPQDMPTVRSIVKESGKDSFAFYDIVQGIVKSEQFRYVQASAESIPVVAATDRRDDTQQLVGQQ